MPKYTDEQAREIHERPMSEVYAYYEDLARQRRPIVERAIATLTGASTGAQPEHVEPEADEAGLDEPDLDDDDEDALPEEPPEA